MLKETKKIYIRIVTSTKSTQKMQKMPKLPPLVGSASTDTYSKHFSGNTLTVPQQLSNQPTLSSQSPQPILPQPFSIVHHLKHQSDMSKDNNNESGQMKKQMINAPNQNQFVQIGTYGRKDWLA